MFKKKKKTAKMRYEGRRNAKNKHYECCIKLFDDPNKPDTWLAGAALAKASLYRAPSPPPCRGSVVDERRANSCLGVDDKERRANLTGLLHDER